MGEPIESKKTSGSIFPTRLTRVRVKLGKSDIRTQHVARGILSHKGRVIGKGADKVVVELKRESSLRRDLGPQVKHDYVLVLPLKKWFLSKKKIFEKERQKMRELAQSAKDPQDRQYVDVEFTPLKTVRGGRVEIETTDTSTSKAGLHAILKEKAEGDFEKAISSQMTEGGRKLRFPERIRLAHDFLAGMTVLSVADCAHGDIKPQNCLVYRDSRGSLSLKVSDFGKTQKVAEGETKPYRGNIRFVAPEGRVSKQGDVYGAALVVIRTLEEFLGDSGESLVKIDKKDKEAQAIKKRRGIEKYIVEHKAFLGADTPGLPSIIYKGLPRRARLEKQTKKQKERQQKLLEGYVNALIEGLEGKNIKCGELGNLLKEMLHVDPQKRPTMEEAFNRFKNIFPKELSSKGRVGGFSYF